MRVFLDCEMTGLHQGSSLISLGLVAENGKQFYAEFTDYNENQCDDWIKENVVANLQFTDMDVFEQTVGDYTLTKNTTHFISGELHEWLSQFKTVELWSDCHHYDMVLFMELFGGAFGLPTNVYYIPFDISTMFKVLGIDPDISREAFIDTPIDGVKHNSLYDAKVIQACFEKLQRNKHLYPITI